jgi:hypothetical protein
VNSLVSTPIVLSPLHREERAANIDMPTLIANYRMAFMPNTTHLARILKGLEDLYYVLLLTTDSALGGRGETWRGWLELGFHVNTRTPPPGLPVTDRVRSFFDHGDGRHLRWSLESRRADVLGEVRAVLDAVEAARRRLCSREAPDRVQMLHSDVEINGRLLQPLRGALELSGCGQEYPRFEAAMDRALTSLTAVPIVEAGITIT